MYNNTEQAEKMAVVENVADGKIMADVKIKAGPKIPADGEILAHSIPYKQLIISIYNLP